MPQIRIQREDDGGFKLGGKTESQAEDTRLRAEPIDPRFTNIGSGDNEANSTIGQQANQSLDDIDKISQEHSNSRNYQLPEVDRSRSWQRRIDNQNNRPETDGNRSTQRFADNQQSKLNAPQRQTVRRPIGSNQTQSYPTTSTKTQPGTANAAGAPKDRNFVKSLAEAAGAAKGYAGKNKKGLLIGGGIAGLLATIVLAFFALLPLKIEAFLKAVLGDKPMARVEHAMQRRATRVFIRFALQNAINPAGGIVATGNPLGDLYRTWRVQQFEGKLFEKSGLKVSKGSTPNSIRVTLPEGAKEFKGTEEFRQYLDNGDLKGKQARAFMERVIKDNTKWYQIIRRRNMRVWWRNAYDIRRKIVFKNNESEADTKKNFNRNLGKVQNDNYLRRVGSATNCVMSGTSCPKGTPESDAKIVAEDPGGEGNKAARAATQATEEAMTEVTSREINKSVAKKILAVLTSKTVALIGFFDMAARIDDFMWNDRGKEIIADVRKAQYVSVFATWLKLSDQIKDGTATAMQLNMALEKLDGLEKSAAFQELFMDSKAGVQIAADKTLKVGSEYQDGLHWIYKHNPMMVAYHGVFWAYLHSAGYLVEYLTDFVGWLITLVPGIESLLQWIGQVFVELLMWYVGPVITDEDGGEAIGNAARLGSNINANEFNHAELGAPPIKPDAAEKVGADIRESNRVARGSLWNSLFSTEDGTSFVSRLAVTMPSSPMVAVRNGFSSMLTAISNPLAIPSAGIQYAFNTADISNTFAADDSNVDRWGVAQYGWTTEQLDAEIDDKQLADLQAAADKAKSEGRNLSQILSTDCPSVPEGQPNYCKLNIATIQSLKSIYTKEDDGGYDSVPSTTTGPSIPAPPPGASCGTSQQCAQLLLQQVAAGKLDFKDCWDAAHGKFDCGPVRKDLETVASGGTIKNADSCNNAVTIHPQLLNALYQATQRWKISVDSFVTTHGGACRSGLFHPQGRAMDIWYINDKRTNSSMGNPNALNTAFAEFMGPLLLPGGEILQANKCFPAKLPKGIDDGADTCDHIHVSVGHNP